MGSWLLSRLMSLSDPHVVAGEFAAGLRPQPYESQGDLPVNVIGRGQAVWRNRHTDLSPEVALCLRLESSLQRS